MWFYMTKDTPFITGTMIKDYMFCPTIFYYKHIMRIYEPETEMMRSGRRIFEEIERKADTWKTLLGMRKIKPDRVIYSAKVYSSKYGLAGIIDIVYWAGGKCHVLEVKDSDLKKPEMSHIYQTAIYALMAEETFSTTVVFLEIYYTLSQSYHKYRFTSGVRRYSVSILNKIKGIISGHFIPEPRFSRKCHSCWYKSECQPGRQIF